KQITTPQLTPQAMQPSISVKTPPSGNITLRSGSPKKLFKPELRTESVKKSPISSTIFHHNGPTGQLTPTVVLRPRKRAASGLGIDKDGLGSPRVAAILDRRRSISDDAQDFVAQAQASGDVRFDE